MKKLLTVLFAFGLGYIAWIEVAKRRQAQAVWHEVTDPID